MNQEKNWFYSLSLLWYLQTNLSHGLSKMRNVFFFFHSMLENHTKILCKTSCIGKGLLTLWRQIRFHLKLRGTYCSIMFQPRVPGLKTQHSVPKAVIWNIFLLVYIHLHISTCIDARWCKLLTKKKLFLFILWLIIHFCELLQV